MSIESNPYISFVITGRNDDYGGDFNERLTNGISWLSIYLEKYKCPSEVIIVNYNPIDDKPSLRQIISWPRNRNYLQFRMITVPNDVHQTLINPEIRKTVPLFEFPAKNIGIRRARANFILSSNADIIYDSRIIKYISKQTLSPAKFYRADRADFDGFTYTGDILDRPQRFLRKVKKKTFLFSLKGFKYGKFKVPMPFSSHYNLNRLINGFRLKRERFIFEHKEFFGKYKIWSNPDNAEYYYHCTNCGDFMLMQKDHWFALRAYPEDTYISTHTDSIFTLMAATYGLKEKVFNFPIYHQHHGRRYDWADIDSQQNEMMTKVYRNFEDLAQEMIKLGKPKIFNNENWGLKDFNFEEEIF